MKRLFVSALVTVVACAAAVAAARAAEPAYQRVVQPDAPQLEELGQQISSVPRVPVPPPPLPGQSETPPETSRGPQTPGGEGDQQAGRCAARDERSPCARLPDPDERRQCLDKFHRFARPTAVVVSGGVSLGSHQGGLLYYLSQFLRSYSERVRGKLEIADQTVQGGDIRVATGASAGSINAFLSAMASCREPVARPEESLFYRTWIPVGMDGLDNRKDVTAASVLSRAPIEAAICRIRGLWEPGHHEGCGAEDLAHPLQGSWSDNACQGRVAFNVTRVEARDVPLPFAEGAGALSAKRQTEQFLIEYRKAQGPGQKPVFYPVSPPEDAMASLYPALGREGPGKPIPLDDVFKLLKASSSFPVAFEPVVVPYRPVTRDAEGEIQVGKLDDKSLFIDGGVFDNTPLGVAVTMSKWTCEDPYYIFVEPDAIGWRKAEPHKSPPEAPDETVLGIYGTFVGDFITVSRQAELLNAIAGHEEIRGKLQVPPRKLPTASGHILNFLGFFERDFRRFDFYLGMTDSWDYLRQSSAAAERNQSGNRQYAVLSDQRALPTFADPVFQCFVALRAAEPPNFAAGGKLPDPSTEPACRTVSLSDKNLLALYRTARDLRQYTQTPGWRPEREEDRFFELLGHYGYQFHDLKSGSRPVRADEAEDTVRARLQGLVHGLAEAQPGTLSGGAVSVAGKAALNTLRYRTPRAALEVDVGINGPGLGLALLASSSGGWRVELGASLEPWHREQLDMTAGSSPSWTMQSAGALLLGKEFAFGGSSQPPSGRWQLSLALGGDIRSVTENRDFFPYLVPRDQLMWRVGPTARLRLTFYQRLTLGLAATYWPDHCEGNNLCARASDRAATLNPVVSERIRVSVFVGWRLLDIFGTN
jgi:hypothetical protein